MEQDEHIQHFLVHPQNVLRPLWGCRVCLPRRQLCVGLTCSGCRVPFSFFSLFTEGQASLKADLPWSSGRWMGLQECCCRYAEKLHNAAQFHGIPFGLWGSSCLPSAGHHKRIVTGLLTWLKLNSLPKLFLGKRAAQEEGLQKSKEQNSPWNQVMFLWQGTVVWGELGIFWMDV